MKIRLTIPNTLALASGRKTVDELSIEDIMQADSLLEQANKIELLDDDGAVLKVFKDRHGRTS